MNALDTPERRKQFSSTWGTAFGTYCLDRLATIFRGKKWSFVPNPIDESTDEELWDGLATRDDTAIVIECKGTFIRSAEKYSGQPGRFFRGLTQKFGRVSPDVQLSLEPSASVSIVPAVLIGWLPFRNPLPPDHPPRNA